MRHRLVSAVFAALPVLAACQPATSATVTAIPPVTAGTTAAVPTMSPVSSSASASEAATTGATTMASTTPTAPAASPSPSATRPAFTLAVPAGWRVDSSQTDSPADWRAQIRRGDDGAMQFVRVEASKKDGFTSADASTLLSEALQGECPSGTRAPAKTIAGTRAAGIHCAEGELESVTYAWAAGGHLYRVTHLAEGVTLDEATLTRVLAGLTLKKP